MVTLQAIVIVLGSRDFHLSGLTIRTAGKLPNNIPPLVTPS